MEDNVDVSKELAQKNQEILHNKKASDLEKTMESLALFFRFHTLNAASDINNKVCMDQGIDPNNIHDKDQAEIYYNTLVTFFSSAAKALEDIIKEECEVIKDKLDSLSDVEYESELKRISLVIKNRMLDYFIGIKKSDNGQINEKGSENGIQELANELSQNVDDTVKEKIYKYLYEVISGKMINVLNDNLMISIQVIINNNKENQEVMERINDITIEGSKIFGA